MCTFSESGRRSIRRTNRLDGSKNTPLYTKPYIRAKATKVTGAELLNKKISVANGNSEFLTNRNVSERLRVVYKKTEFSVSLGGLNITDSDSSFFEDSASVFLCSFSKLCKHLPLGCQIF